MGHRLLIRLCIFRRHGGLYPIVSGGNPHGFVWFLFCVAPAPFCVVSLFFCWRNANLAGRFAGRRCCRVFSLCFGLTMMCLVYEAKVFHIFCTIFYRFSHCQDRALERDRPQQKEKKLFEDRQSTPERTLSWLSLCTVAFSNLVVACFFRRSRRVVV